MLIVVAKKVPFVLMFYGKQIRARSKLSIELQKMHQRQQEQREQQREQEKQKAASEPLKQQ